MTIKHYIKQISIKLYQYPIMILKWLAIAIVVIIFVAILGINYISYTNNLVNYKKPFNSELWKKRLNVDKTHFDGCYMYQDLIKNYIHIGMTEKEIINLLGNPVEVRYYTNPDIKTYTYYIGNCQPYYFLPHTENVVFYFDQTLHLVDFEDNIYFLYFLWNVHFNPIKNEELKQAVYKAEYHIDSKAWYQWKEKGLGKDR